MTADIEMREDGDIDREYFKERKDELEKRITVLLQEIERLTPKAPEQFTEDFGKTLKKLRKKLEGYVRCDEAKIPEGVVEAFIEKIWVSKDEFRWYLRSGSKDERKDSERVKIAEFTINLDQAKAYQYGFSTRKRIYNSVLFVSIRITTPFLPLTAEGRCLSKPVPKRSPSILRDSVLPSTGGVWTESRTSTSWNITFLCWRRKAEPSSMPDRYRKHCLTTSWIGCRSRIYPQKNWLKF